MISDRRYTEEELLPLSGLQHYAYCRRQWALIHVEQQWQENLLTMEGNILHERAHDAAFIEKRATLLITRSMPLVSLILGVTGKADVVEFKRVEDPANAVKLPKRKGWWQPRPVEYKRGKPKTTNIDRVQLCAQAMCLEEMMGTSIQEGDIFYWEVRAREQVVLNEILRAEVIAIARDMHNMFDNGETPPAKYGLNCRRCSLVNVCVPKLGSSSSVEAYLRQATR